MPLNPVQQIALVHRLVVQEMMAWRRYVVALMPDFTRVDDVVQETFVTATAKPAASEASVASFPPPTQPKQDTNKPS